LEHSIPAAQQVDSQVVMVSGQMHSHVAASSTNGASHSNPGHGVGVAVGIAVGATPIDPPGVVSSLAAGSISQLPVSPRACLKKEW
jgi:hypothetical protein